MIRLVIIIIIVVGWSCNSSNEKSIHDSIKDDTIIMTSANTNSIVEYSKSSIDSSILIKKHRDSVQRIQFYLQLATKSLRKQTKSTFIFDTSYDGAKSHLIFRRVQFQKGQVHTIVQVQDEGGYLPILILQKIKNTWKLNHVFEGTSFVSDSVMIDDYNFDGINDIALRWYYASGRCNCSTGCYIVYLYEPNKKSFIYISEINDHLDVAFSRKEKAIYLGDHCGSDWTKYRWKGYQLVPIESYEFENANRDDYYYTLDTSTIRKHYVYENGERLFQNQSKNNRLPSNWEKLFFQPND